MGEARSRLQVEAVDVGLPKGETDALVEPVGRFTRRARRQVDGTAAGVPGPGQRELVERVTSSRIDPEPYLQYLESKYRRIYEIT